MIQYSILTNVTGTFPNYLAKNATGAGATDGTPYVAAFIDDIWGRFQAILDRAGLTPDGVTESVANSQHIEALRKGFAIGAGYTIMYNKAGLPAANGDRVLLLTGQGILRTNYPELDLAVYVGDANNAAVAAGGGTFYRATDAAGTTPSITGIYLILPDYRGRVPRGDDIAAAVDPLGASRFLGDLQADAMQGHKHNMQKSTSGAFLDLSGTDVRFTGTLNITPTGVPVTDGVNGTPRTSSESRMTNVQTKFGITY